MNKIIDKQPPSIEGETEVFPLVLDDLSANLYFRSYLHPNRQQELLQLVNARVAFGIKKHGRPLQSFNGRDPVVDAFQENLDLLFYLKQAYIELNSSPDYLNLSRAYIYAIESLIFLFIHMIAEGKLNQNE